MAKMLAVPSAENSAVVTVNTSALFRSHRATTPKVVVVSGVMAVAALLLAAAFLLLFRGVWPQHRVLGFVVSLPVEGP